jgi:hypothetical protein
MAQSDQVVQNATFPSVRADINDNLAALFSQSSGNSAPTVTVAYQPWVDTSSSPPVWKIRNGSNTAWISVGILDPAGFNAGGITGIANGGTGATTAALALAALLPSQGGNAGKALVTSGSAASWGTVASGASYQVFGSSVTYTPTAGKTTFLVILTGGGGGSHGTNGFSGTSTLQDGGGAGGTMIRLFSPTELGSTASVVIAGGGAGGGAASSGGTPGDGGTGGTSSFACSGTGGTMYAYGGQGGLWSSVGSAGGGVASSGGFGLEGGRGQTNGSFLALGGMSFWGGAYGRGGYSPSGAGSNGGDGVQGLCAIFEW